MIVNGSEISLTPTRSPDRLKTVLAESDGIIGCGGNQARVKLEIEKGPTFQIGKSSPETICTAGSNR